MVDGFAGAFLCGCQAVSAAVIAASAVAARRRRRVARPVLRLLFLVGAVLEAVEQTKAVCSCAVMHWSLVPAFHGTICLGKFWPGFMPLCLDSDSLFHVRSLARKPLPPMRSKDLCRQHLSNDSS